MFRSFFEIQLWACCRLATSNFLSGSESVQIPKSYRFLGESELTQFSNIAQLHPGGLLEDVAVVRFACDIDAEDDGLVEHLVELSSGTQVLGDLGLRNNEKVPGYVHEPDEQLEVLLERRIVLSYQCCALLGSDALVRVVEARQGADGPCGETRDGGSEIPGEPYPDLDALGESLSVADVRMRPTGRPGKADGGGGSYLTSFRFCVFSSVLEMNLVT